MEMDEHKKMEEESSPEQQPREQEAEGNTEESMDQSQDGYKEGRTSAEQEPKVVHRKEVHTGCSESEEVSSPAWSLLDILLASPCSVLQYLIRACTGWRTWGLHGPTFDDDDDGPNKPQQQHQEAAAGVAPEANAAAEQGDDKTNNYFYMQGVVIRVWAVRMRRPPSGAPGRPREGKGGNGGSHN